MYGTITDFWRLVWQEKVQNIAMLTNLMEGRQRKCEQYWPESGSEEYGPFMVTLIEEQVFADYTIRTMHLVVGRNQSHSGLNRGYHNNIVMMMLYRHQNQEEDPTCAR